MPFRQTYRATVVDFDMYMPAGIEDGYHTAWSRLQSPDTPSLVWTPRNGGHWIATRGKWVKEIYSDPELSERGRIAAPGCILRAWR